MPCCMSSYFSEGKVYTSFASKPDRRQLTSALGIPAAPTTSPSASQQIPPPTTEADDQKVSYIIHDPLSCSDGDGGNSEEKYSRDCLALWFSYSS